MTDRFAAGFFGQKNAGAATRKRFRGGHRQSGAILGIPALLPVHRDCRNSAASSPRRDVILWIVLGLLTISLWKMRVARYDNMVIERHNCCVLWGSDDPAARKITHIFCGNRVDNRRHRARFEPSLRGI
jgi:hypothetical protein